VHFWRDGLELGLGLELELELGLVPEVMGMQDAAAAAVVVVDEQQGSAVVWVLQGREKENVVEGKHSVWGLLGRDLVLQAVLSQEGLLGRGNVPGLETVCEGGFWGREMGPPYVVVVVVVVALEREGMPV